MNNARFHHLRDQLSDRDHAILTSLERFRLLSSKHLERLHFHDHANPIAAARATNRALRRLATIGVIAPLERRIGGTRRGSASYIWQLAATGEHYLRACHGKPRRRRYTEPSHTFTAHTLAVNDIAVALIEADRTILGFTIDQLHPEPANWRTYLGPGGETRWLKPDLHVIATITGEGVTYEDHALLEIDEGSEHTPRIQAKCRVYAEHAATGTYQAEHELYPSVTWISSSPNRRRLLRSAIATTPGLPKGLFQVLDPNDYLRLATRDHLPQPSNEGTDSAGEAPHIRRPEGGI